MQQLVDKSFDSESKFQQPCIWMLDVDSFYHQWKQFQHLPLRDMDTVVLPSDLKRRILSDVESFFNNRHWYERIGIPHRRGYLLHGPPGTGKTSLIMSLAKALHMQLCIISLSSVSDPVLLRMFRLLPMHACVVLEDVDAAFQLNQRKDDDNGEKEDTRALKQHLHRQNNVTLAGLLNVLDGIGSGVNRVVFMTTNYPDRLDKALIRPGRIDCMFEIGYATEQQIAELYARFFAHFNNVHASARAFAAAALQCKEHAVQLTMANVQEFLMRHRHATSAADICPRALQKMVRDNDNVSKKID